MIETAHSFISQTGKQLGLPEDVIHALKRIDQEHIFDVKLKNGKSFKGYRIQHNNARGPYKGGIRFHKDVSLDEVRTLATLMSLKTAAAGLPLGGGKGGVAVDPRELDQAELEELSREYVRQLHRHIGPDTDIPAPDVNTNAQIIDWMIDEYETLTGDTSKASFTGKSIANGGSLGRDAATGRGGVLALAELLKLEREPARKLTYAVQGYGNVGSFFAVTAAKLQPQWQLLAASDSEAAVYSREGLEARELQEFKEKQRGRFKNYKGQPAKAMSNDELLALPVDVLVLAGLEDSVTGQNAHTIKATHIVEMANGPITAEAHETLTAAGKVVLPDIVANSGGVIVSYLEWVQNRQHEQWTERQVNDKLAGYMKKAVKNMYDRSQKYEIDLKNAAFIVALERLTKS